MNSILAFHAVTSGTWFADVVAWLQTRYEMVGPDRLLELYRKSETGGNACHLTVDDGHQSFTTAILPVLRRCRIPATLFVSPHVCSTKTNYWFQEVESCNHAELKRRAAAKLCVPAGALEPFSVESVLKALSIKDVSDVIRDYREATCTRVPAFQNLSVGDLEDVASSGVVTLGAHTMTHPILANETAASAEYEIKHSIDALSRLVGGPVQHFAYPNGIPGIDFTAREEACAARQGIRMAFSTESRHLRPLENLLCLPRIQITDGESLTCIRAKILCATPWRLLKHLKPGGEYDERRRLRKRLTRAA